MTRPHKLALIFCTLVVTLGISMLIATKYVPTELVDAIEMSQAQAAVAPAEVLIFKTETSLTEETDNSSGAQSHDLNEHKQTAQKESNPSITTKSPPELIDFKEPSSGYDVKELSKLIQVLTNNSRSKSGLPPLAQDNTLTKLAVERSNDMIANNYFSHTSQNGCDLACRFKNVDFVTYHWGENLAQSTGYDLESENETAQTFLKGWLGSISHRENILSSDFTRQGIGIATKGDRLVLTVLFAE